jgi:hypothetical protein
VAIAADGVASTDPVLPVVWHQVGADDVAVPGGVVLVVRVVGEREAPGEHRDLQPAGPTRRLAPPGHQLDLRPQMEGAGPCPDLWDPNSENGFSMPDTQPDPIPSGHDDHAQQVWLKDDRGRLRLPAYVLIALVLALAAITVSIVAVLVGFR